MQVVPWIILSIFMKQGSAFLQEHDYLKYQLWKTKLLIATFV